MGVLRDIAEATPVERNASPKSTILILASAVRQIESRA